jgi:hypothetical protein
VLPGRLVLQELRRRDISVPLVRDENVTHLAIRLRHPGGVEANAFGKRDRTAFLVPTPFPESGRLRS